MPLFQVRYNATSNAGQSMSVRVCRHDTWYLVVPKDHDDPSLICAMAFLQKKRLTA
jgi:hypothetical protein